MILLVAYGGGHIKMIHRIYDCLKNNGISSQILPLTTAVPYCINNNIDRFIKLEELLNFEEDIPKEYKDTIFKIAQDNHNDTIGVPFEHTLAYYATGLKELFDENGIINGLKIFQTKKRSAFLPKKFARKVLKKMRPKAVFTTNSPRMEYAFQLEAFSMGLKSFAIDDLIGKPLIEFVSDVVFVDNNFSAENIKSSNYKGKIVVSGNPVYEDLSKYKSLQANNNLLILLQTGIRNMKDQKVTLLNEDFYSTFFKSFEFLDFAKGFEKVTVRFHPSMESKRLWDDNKITIDDESNLHVSLSNYSSVMGFTSTSVYEGYLMGCKTYALSFGSAYFELPMHYSGMIYFDGRFKLLNKGVQNDTKDSEQELSRASDIILKTVKDEIFYNYK